MLVLVFNNVVLFVFNMPATLREKRKAAPPRKKYHSLFSTFKRKKEKPPGRDGAVGFNLHTSFIYSILSGAHLVPGQLLSID